MRPISILALALISYFVAQGTGIRLFFHLSYMLVALLVISLLWAWINLRGLRLNRETFTQRTQVGGTAQERISITNLWPIPKLWIELRDHSDLPLHASGFVTYLPGHERRRWSTKTPCTMRGKFTLGPATVVSGDPFGIFRLERTFEGANDILVYPRTTPLPGFVLPSAELPGGQDVKSRAYHVTPNVSSIRDYQPGDSLNRIHWRSSARANKLMVKEFELDPTAEVYVVLDMQERVHQQLVAARKQRDEQAPSRSVESTEEYGVQAASSIIRHLLDQNRTIGLISWGQHREVVSAERESRQLFKMLEALAVLRAHGAQPLAEVLAAESTRFGRNCTLLIITPSLDERWVASLQQLLYRGVRAAVVLIDPQSFGGWRDTLTIQSRLAELRVPFYLLQQGQSIESALRQPAAFGAPAPTRATV